jgi:hypothetical protein
MSDIVARLNELSGRWLELLIWCSLIKDANREALGVEAEPAGPSSCGLFVLCLRFMRELPPLRSSFESSSASASPFSLSSSFSTG